MDDKKHNTFSSTDFKSKFRPSTRHKTCIKHKTSPEQEKSQPWVPAGRTGTCSTLVPASGGEHGQNNTSNILGQTRSEKFEAHLTQTGSLQTTLYNVMPMQPRIYSRFSGVRSGSDGIPVLALGQPRDEAARSRIYVSLDSPGMGDRHDSDRRMDRAQVGKLYRSKYCDQQEKKQEDNLIPGTYHVETALGVNKHIAMGAVGQMDRGYTKAQRKLLDQESDVHKYQHAYGLIPKSFDAIDATADRSSVRLAVSRRDDRDVLKTQYSPSCIVHPNELLTKAESMTLRSRSASDAAMADRRKLNPTCEPLRRRSW